MSEPSFPDDADSAAREIEQLLAKSIGPMAKIVLARARKRARDDEALLDALAQSIEHEAERAAFVSAATRVLTARKKSGAADLLANTREDPVQDAAVVSSSGTSTLTHNPAPRAAPRADEVMKPGAIFISYARDNIEVARQLASALRDAGLDVWLDLGKLQPGDAWDLKIRRNIEACSFFIALVSRETEARREGYFRREWNIAADRAMNFADDEPFLLPVSIDDTAAHSARVPERFRGMHWTTLPGGEVTSEFVHHVKALVDEYRRRHP